MRVFAEINIPAVVAGLADDLCQGEADAGVLPLSRIVKLSHVDQLQKISPHFPDLTLNSRVQTQNFAHRLYKLQCWECELQMRPRELWEDIILLFICSLDHWELFVYFVHHPKQSLA